MSDAFSFSRTEMFTCLNPCLMLFAMEPTKWVFRWVQVSSYFGSFNFGDESQIENPLWNYDHSCNSSIRFTLDGFLFVEELLAHPQFRSYSLEDVERVVATNDKQRFKLRSHPDDGRLQIRANQGHSVQVCRAVIFTWCACLHSKRYKRLANSEKRRCCSLG